MIGVVSYIIVNSSYYSINVMIYSNITLGNSLITAINRDKQPTSIFLFCRIKGSYNSVAILTSTLKVIMYNCCAQFSLTDFIMGRFRLTQVGCDVTTAHTVMVCSFCVQNVSAPFFSCSASRTANHHNELSTATFRSVCYHKCIIKPKECIEKSY